MRLVQVVNCCWWGDGACRNPRRPDGIGDQPSAGVCLHGCPAREPHTIGPATLGWYALPDPVKLAADEVSVCASRIADEWPAEWQAKIEAATVRMAGTRHVLKLAFYREAMKHRR